jgi:hypothetical protein
MTTAASTKTGSKSGAWLFRTIGIPFAPWMSTEGTHPARPVATEGNMRISPLSRISLGFALMMITATAAFAQKVSTDYDKSADFAQYKTFMWIKEPKTTDPLMRQRVIEDVNAALAAKGLKLVTSNADICVAAHAATKEERTLNTFYNGFGGGWRWGGGFGSATTTVNDYEVGTLVVDLFDAKTKGGALERHLEQNAVGQFPEECRQPEQGCREDVQGLSPDALSKEDLLDSVLEGQ